jgi:ribosome maturation factor RimP
VRREDLVELVRPIVDSEGYELVECSISRTQRSQTFRFSIDREGGVTIEACARLSRAIASALDTNPVVRGTYLLEVSSAGMNRPIWSAEHFARFAGERVRVELVEGDPKNLAGTIGPLEGEGVWIRPDRGEAKLVGLREISRAQVQIDPWRKKGEQPGGGADKPARPAAKPGGKKRG